MADFYGNITNPARTQFIFDRIFQNRYEMDLSSNIDGVYIGRHVLVNYEKSSLSSDIYSKPYFCYEAVEGEPKMYENMATHLSSPSSGMDLEQTGDYNSGATLYLDATREPFYSEPVLSTLVTADNGIVDGQIVRIEPGRHIFNLNTEPIYVKVTDTTDLLDLKYTIVTYTEYEQYWTEERLEEANKMHLHKVNDIVSFSKANEVYDGVVLRIPPGYSYETNKEDPELWTAAVDYETGNITWLKSVNEDASNYLHNYNIDKAFYGHKRGYDSTVWQKVFTNGVESYIMVAELNTIVPTFDIAFDAPSMLPKPAHYDDSSTNMYYKIHSQPQWGFRLKAARNDLYVPVLDEHGRLPNEPEEVLTREKTDSIYYPSDEQTAWKHRFFNNIENAASESIYNAQTKTWEPLTTSNKGLTLESAVYYNKKGFQPDKISYSQDIIDTAQKAYHKSIRDSGWTNTKDSIMITPTGISGNVYADKWGIKGAGPAPDIQELSIMLPSLGDSMAKIWDLVYGGRETNAQIKVTNFRNTDIEWEDGLARALRKGLRLVNNHEGGIQYNKNEVNTIAGCINSVHDLLGMIIVPVKAITDENDVVLQSAHEVLTEKVSNLDINKIYYDEQAHSYKRKRQKHDNYIPLTDEDYGFYEMLDINETTFNPLMYYVNNAQGEKERVVTPLTYDNNASYYNSQEKYYVKTLRKDQLESYEQINVDKNNNNATIPMTIFDGTKYFYQDWYQNLNVDMQNILLYDYISDMQYYPDKQYYTIEAAEKRFVEDEDGNPVYYEPGLYYYHTQDTYMLDVNKKPYSLPYINSYYAINRNLVKRVSELTNKSGLFYTGIYIPGEYFYEEEYINEKGETDTRYVINNEPTGLITSGPDEGKNREYFKVLKDDQGNYFKKTTTFVPVPEGVLTAQNYLKDFYYLNSEGTVIARDEFNSKTTYYQKKVIYTHDDTALNVDRDAVQRLLPWYLNTYAQCVFNTAKQVIGYKFLSLEELRTLYYEDPVHYWDDIVIFGTYGTTNGGDVDLKLPMSVILDPEQYAIQKLDTFYEPFKYHYRKNGSYILDANPEKTHDKYYVLTRVTPTPDNIVFYEPNKQFVKDNSDNFVPSRTDPSMMVEEDLNQPFYKQRHLYVIEDDAGIYEVGSEWNPEATLIPANVKLASKPLQEEYELVALPEFARNMNTLHGMVLKMNQFLEIDNRDIRDENTITGGINKLKDLFAKFDKMVPSSISVADEYGRLTTAKLDTNQQLSCSNIKADPEYNYNDIGADTFPIDREDKKEWITIKVNGCYKDPTISIHHNFMPVNNTHWTVDYNTITRSQDEQAIESHFSEAASRVLEKAHGGTYFMPEAELKQLDFEKTLLKDFYQDSDTLEMYVPKIDAMGHVVGTANYTAILPYSYKYMAIKTLSDSANDLIEKRELLSANHTMDKVLFSTANKWIKMSMEVSGDEFSPDREIIFGHKLSPLAAKYWDHGAQTPNFNETFDITVFKTDEAGHVIESKVETVLIPHLTEVTSGTGNVLVNMSLDNVADTLTKTFNYVGNLALGVYSKISTDNTGAIGTTTTLSSAIATLDERIYQHEVSNAAAFLTVNKAIEDLPSTMAFDFDVDPTTLTEEEIAEREENNVVVPKKTLQDLYYKIYRMEQIIKTLANLPEDEEI